MKKFIIRKIPIVIAFAALGIFLFSGVVMLLWNSILTAVLHVSAITLWQAAGILLLSKILFSGFRGRRRGWHAPQNKMFWHKRSVAEGENMHHLGCYYDQYKCGGFSGRNENPVA